MQDDSGAPAVRIMIEAASDSKDTLDYALSSILFSILAIAYIDKKVDLKVVYESYRTRPTQFTSEYLIKNHGDDLLVLYEATDRDLRQGINIPVPYLCEKVVEKLVIFSELRDRLVHRRTHKFNVVPSSQKKKKEKNAKRKVTLYGKSHDYQALLSTACEFRAFVKDVSIKEVLFLDTAPQGKIKATNKYAEDFGFRTGSDYTRSLEHQNVHRDSGAVHAF